MILKEINNLFFEFKTPLDCFKKAIDGKRFSLSPWDFNYYGQFKYVGTFDNGNGIKDQFKHVNGKSYLA